MTGSQDQKDRAGNDVSGKRELGVKPCSRFAAFGLLGLNGQIRKARFEGVKSQCPQTAGVLNLGVLNMVLPSAEITDKRS